MKTDFHLAMDIFGKSAQRNTTSNRHRNWKHKRHEGENIICWQEEALAIIQDVEAHVAYIGVSEQLESKASCIYLNVRTLEGDTYCVSASKQGFAIKSKQFDTIDAEQPGIEGKTSDVVSSQHKDNTSIIHYETIYSLINHVSPMYVNSFGTELCAKLQQLNEIYE